MFFCILHGRGGKGKRQKWEEQGEETYGYVQRELKKTSSGKEKEGKRKKEKEPGEEKGWR